MPSNTNAVPELTDEQLLAAIDLRLQAAESELAELDAKRQPLLDNVERLRTTRAVYAGDQPAPAARRASARKPVDEATRAARAAKARERRAAKAAAAPSA
jgi:hypothetical protein